MKKREFEELKLRIIIKLHRRGNIGIPVDFEDFLKINPGISRNDLYKALKKLHNMGIVKRWLSNESSFGRWALNSHTKELWGGLVLKAIKSEK